MHVLNRNDLFPALKKSGLHCSPSIEYQQYHLLTQIHRGAVGVQAQGLGVALFLFVHLCTSHRELSQCEVLTLLCLYVLYRPIHPMCAFWVGGK